MISTKSMSLVPLTLMLALGAKVSEVVSPTASVSIPHVAQAPELNKLWDRDVVEFFLGGDWTDIKNDREFEIAPTGDWVDLAIDLNPSPRVMRESSKSPRSCGFNGNEKQV